MYRPRSQIHTSLCSYSAYGVAYSRVHARKSSQKKKRMKRVLLISCSFITEDHRLDGN